MNRINVFRRKAVGSEEVCSDVRSNPAACESVAWGKIHFDQTGSVVMFAALLIVCSLAVGCSSDKGQPATTNTQSAVAPPVVSNPPSAPTAPVLQAEAKPVHKKAVRRVAPTLTYADKTSGVSFQYPRKYSLKTGDAADELVSSDPVPMNFVQPGGVAIAAITVPESAYPKSDLGTAFFDVSMNKALTAEQCGQFPADKPANPETPETAKVQSSKLMIGDMELQSSETLASQGTREEAAKYYHVFENGTCYEFALKVATMGVETEGAKHVDREEVFKKLEGILATVKIAAPADPVTASEPVAVTGTAAQ